MLDKQINDNSADYTENIDLSKQQIQSVSEEICFLDSTTPRSVPLSSIVTLLFGSAGMQHSWLLFGITMISIWVFGMDIDYSQLLFTRGYDTTQGIVTSIEKTSFSVGGSKGITSIPILMYSYTFVDSKGIKRSSKSYNEDVMSIEQGQKVSVEYLHPDSAVSRISGMLRKPVGWPGLIVFIFPLVGLLMIISYIVSGIKKIKLLKNGKIVPAELKSVSEIVSRSRNRAKSVCYRLVFTYTTLNGVTYEHFTDETNPESLGDQKLEPLLYNPKKPSSAVLLNSLPGRPRIDSTGNIVNKKSLVLTALCSLLIPVAVVFCHYYYYVNYVK